MTSIAPSPGLMKRGALFHLHRRAQAVLTSVDGWEAAAQFGDAEQEAAAARRSAGLADVSHRRKYELRGPGEGAWQLSAGRYLAVAEPPAPAPAGGFDVTSVYAGLLLAGPRSRDVLAKLSSLDTSAAPEGRRAWQTAIAHVHAIVLRENAGALDGFHILVTRDWAESVWEAILHAGEEFGVRAIGLDALRLLRS